MAYSLTYSYDSSIQSYSVTGYSNITTSDKVIIQSTYDDGTNGSHPVTRIGNAAFSGCSGLTSVTIPDSVTFIGNGAFYGCKGLTRVTIPDSVTFIGGSAFYDCTNLTQLILFPSTPPTLGSSAIPSTISKIYVQQSSKVAYQAATNWTAFASKIVSDNIYLSFVRFNQKNKEYIDKKIQDNDIASLNVVDGTAEDNQVELQITKQDAGTIDGPAIVGKDGITIDKAADSEKIEISGKGCVQHYGGKDYIRAYVVDNTGWDTTMIIRAAGDNSKNTLMRRKSDGSGEIVMPETPVDLSITNKKYVDDNYVKIPSPAPTNWSVLVYAPQSKNYTSYPMNINAAKLSFPYRDFEKMNFKVGDLTADDDGQYCANKNYVDNADKTLRLKLSNLEQALNGYILDTTKETYADLDSAVLKNSVAIGDNVYPIADKTRALVTRIEGKTTKMVQLLDKSKFSATTTNRGVTFTNNGNGSVTVTGTLVNGVAENIYSISNLTELIKGHKYLLSGCPEGGEGSTYMLRLNVYNPDNRGWDDVGAGCIFTFDMEYYDRNVGGIYIYERQVGTEINRTYTPQFFDLTAMNREDITTVEQFKAEFPDLYPYENGNIYPAKISGVKFYEKQDKSGEQGSVTLPETYDLHGIGDYKDYLEITKNEDNELYTLKKIQAIDKHVFDGTEAWVVSSRVLTICQAFYTEAVNCLFVYDGKGGLSNHLPLGVWSDDIEHIQFGQSNNLIYVFLNKEKFKTDSDVKEYLAAQYASGNPLIAYYILPTPVETVIATNLTYEQVTAIRHNGGLIEVEDNTNKGYARPTVTNTIVYRLTATNTVEG